MKERFQKEVDTLMNEFDFGGVHYAMNALNWKWVHIDEAIPKVPSLDEIKKRGKELIQEAAEKAVLTKDEYVVSTGGFRAEAIYYPKEGIKKSFLWVRLAFVLQDWDNCE
jgi:hypothetical protein